MADSFTVRFSHGGKSISVPNVPRETTAAALLAEARGSFGVDDGTVLRLLFKGKTIAREGAPCAAAADTISDGSNDATVDGSDRPAFPEGTRIPKGGARVIVMGSAAAGIRALNSLRSDPLLRGLGDEGPARPAAPALSAHWGPLHSRQGERYRFCRFEECADASFGSRPGAAAPHAFEARRLLHRLAADPGVVAVMAARELVVGTLGEIDPVDDRLMRRKREEGGCLLGYNTNGGMRIDVGLRAGDLSFRPYRELAATLIHELSHNWVGDHNALFWTNYGSMRVEYLWKHACLMTGGVFAGGKRTAYLAGIADMLSPSGNGSAGANSNTVGNNPQTMGNICQSVLAELAREMAQHRIPVQIVAPAVLAFGKELMMETKDDAMIDAGGHVLGSKAQTGGSTPLEATSARERSLAAAEKRAKDARDKQSG